MQGPDRRGAMRGIIPRIVEDIFNFIDVAPEFFEFTVRVRALRRAGPSHHSAGHIL